MRDARSAGAEVDGVDANRVDGDHDTTPVGAVHGAQVGAAVLGAETVRERVVVIGFERGVATDLEVAARGSPGRG